MESLDLPVPVKDHPHWRVNFRPLSTPEAPLTLTECLAKVQRAQVRLRGWYYPHISNRESERQLSANYLAFWSSFQDHIEYWRFYQSTQFIHLFVIEEAINEMWDKMLRANATSELPGLLSSEKVPHFLSIDNFIYTVTEIFEFAARLAGGDLYQKGISISIRLNGINKFGLAFSSFDRAMLHLYQASDNSLGNTWEFKPDLLVSTSSDAALNCVLWFFERFGWLKPPKDFFKSYIEDYLAGRR
jgi:hypothetical protein